jgi:hypothetical protein
MTGVKEIKGPGSNDAPDGHAITSMVHGIPSAVKHCQSLPRYG